MATLSEWRIYITQDKILVSNDLGFRMEFSLPIAGNMVAITLNECTYHVGLYPANVPMSPANQSSLESSVSSNGDGGPEDPIQL